MLIIVLVFIAICPSNFAIILTRKRELVALLLFACYCICSMAPHGAEGWSAACDCGIS